MSHHFPMRRRMSRLALGDAFGETSLAYALRLVAGLKLLARGDAEELATCDLFLEFVRTPRERERSSALSATASLRRLRKRVDEAVHERVPAPPEPLAGNLATIGPLLGLRSVDRDLLQFLVVLREDARLQEVVNRVMEPTIPQIARIVAHAIGHPPEAVLAALQADAPLVSTGLCRPSLESPFLEQRIELDHRLVEVLLLPGLGPDRLLERFLPIAEPPSLSSLDYGHVSTDLDLAIRLLGQAVRGRAAGVNLLLHGPTGTGKTEFARLVAGSVGARLFVAGRETRSGESASPRQRLASLLLGNQLLAQSSSVLLFDEMEDLFSSPLLGLDHDADGAGRGGTSKQWLNRLLETNRVATVWVTNSVEDVDPAYLRRFTHSIELPPLGRAQRKRVWNRHLGAAAGALGEETVEGLAQRFATSAAQVSSVVRAARLASGQDVPQRADLWRLAEASDALVSGRRGRPAPLFTPSSYDLSVLQTPVDLERLAARLVDFAPGESMGVSLCLYGPPGTGKSEFVRYLAHRTDRPLAVHRVSDLESKWVGEAEKNIANAFRAAEDEGAVLVFDEADSFLRDRRDAVRGWEVTRVNEFLQQLESFRGIVACTTNLFRQLDAASLRRFTFKVPFDYLPPDKAARLFRQAFQSWLPPDGPLDESELVRALRGLACLAPGDFAAVARRGRALGARWTAQQLVSELALEVSVKERAARPIGF
jgi:SpoVK/Ycf46/Vps4 family AAA+-type ATPase